MLLKAYVLAILAFTMTCQLLPSATARVLQSADEVQTRVTVPDIPEKSDEELVGRVAKLESHVGLAPSYPQGYSNATGTSQECQQMKQTMDQHDVLMKKISIISLVVSIVTLTLVLCIVYRLFKHELPQMRSAGPSQDLASVFTVAGSREIIGEAIKQGDPQGIALGILARLAGQWPSLWPEDHMHWADTTKHSAAMAGESVVLVYYSPVLTQEAAEKLCQIIWGMRKQTQDHTCNCCPMKRSSIVYGALAGLVLSADAEDHQELVDMCRSHGLSIWLPSGCWLKGSEQAVIAAPLMSSTSSAL